MHHTYNGEPVPANAVAETVQAQRRPDYIYICVCIYVLMYAYVCTNAYVYTM